MLAEECREKHRIADESTKDWRKKIEKAMFGDDGRSGMVKDINDIKGSLGIVKQIIVPITTAVLASLITAYLLSVLG